MGEEMGDRIGCEEARRYLIGDLTGEPHGFPEGFRRHMEHCAGCRKSRTDYRRVWEVLDPSTTGVSSTALRLVPRWRRGPLLPIAGAAAAVVLALGMVALVRIGRDMTSGPSPDRREGNGSRAIRLVLTEPSDVEMEGAVAAPLDLREGIERSEVVVAGRIVRESVPGGEEIRLDVEAVLKGWIDRDRPVPVLQEGGGDRVFLEDCPIPPSFEGGAYAVLFCRLREDGLHIPTYLWLDRFGNFAPSFDDPEEGRSLRDEVARVVRDVRGAARRGVEAIRSIVPDGRQVSILDLELAWHLSDNGVPSSDYLDDLDFVRELLEDPDRLARARRSFAHRSFVQTGNGRAWIDSIDRSHLSVIAWNGGVEDVSLLLRNVRSPRFREWLRDTGSANERELAGSLRGMRVEEWLLALRELADGDDPVLARFARTALAFSGEPAPLYAMLYDPMDRWRREDVLKTFEAIAGRRFWYGRLRDGDEPKAPGTRREWRTVRKRIRTWLSGQGMDVVEPSGNPGLVLGPLPLPDSAGREPPDMAQWLDRLDHPEYMVREQAMDWIRSTGSDGVLPLLRYLEEGAGGAEGRHRARRILSRTWSPEEIPLLDGDTLFPLAGGMPRSLAVEGEVDGFRLAPDAGHVAYCRWDGGEEGPGVYLLAPTGSSRRILPLPRRVLDEHLPDLIWSPGGRYLVIRSIGTPSETWEEQGGFPDALWCLDTRGAGIPETILNSERWGLDSRRCYVGQPAWSADGDWMFVPFSEFRWSRERDGGQTAGICRDLAYGIFAFRSGAWEPSPVIRRRGLDAVLHRTHRFVLHGTGRDVLALWKTGEVSVRSVHEIDHDRDPPALGENLGIDVEHLQLPTFSHDGRWQRIWNRIYRSTDEGWPDLPRFSLGMDESFLMTDAWGDPRGWSGRGDRVLFWSPNPGERRTYRMVDLERGVVRSLWVREADGSWSAATAED